ncbi:MAG TPA: nitroreductase family deazaflavin-dependent oxidoreductase [Candidatus Dormibacteraeota bacterium]
MAYNFMQRTIDTFHAQQGLGIPPWGDYLLLLTARGAKSGEAHTTPVVYRRRGDDLVIVASKGGYPGNPQWYGNLRANPEAEVEVADGHGGTQHLRVRARPVPSGPERDELYAFMTEVWPGFADYQAKADRTIPVVVLTPV